MPENSFEDEVQQTLDGLKIHPAADVWTNLEKELRERKRRRFALFFFLVAGILLTGSAAYFFLNNNNTKQPVTAVTNKLQQSIDPQQSTNAQHSTNPIGEINTDKGSTAIRRDSSAGITGSSRAVTSALEQVADQGASSARHNRDPLKSPVTNGREHARKGNIATGRPVRPERGIADDNKEKPSTVPSNNDVSQATSPKRSNEHKPASESNAAKQSQDTTSSKIVAANNTASLAGSADSIAAAIHPAKKPGFRIPKRQWVFGFSAGASVTGKFPDRSGVSDPSGTQSYFAPSNGPGLPAITAAVIPPSRSNPAFAFEISGGLQQRISERSSLFAGLAYSHSGNRIRVGDYRTLATTGTTTSPAFNVGVQAYTGNPHKSFFNQYHFLTIPIRYQLLLNPASRVPLQWHLSAAPGYLFSSDALIYSTELGGSYYRDRNAYNRFRMNMGTGLDLMLGRQGLRWSIGPEVNMSLNKLMTNIEDNKQHLYYGGISGKIYFGR